jgi:nucleoside 2-deoxyribosyltransferase
VIAEICTGGAPQSFANFVDLSYLLPDRGYHTYCPIVAQTSSPSLTKRAFSPSSTCFVVAEPTVSVRPIERLLRARGIRPVFQSDLPSNAARLVTSTREGITKADFVLGVFRKGDNTNTAFEMGMAFGLGKPLLVVAPTGVPVPFRAADVVLVRADAKDTAAVSFALDQMLAAPQPFASESDSPIRRTKAIGADAGQFGIELQQLRSSEAPSKAFLLDSLVQRALEATGATVAVREGEPDNGFDLGVWADDLDQSVGNPLVVEVKWQLRTAKDIDQVLRALTRSRAVWALVLFVEGPTPRRIEELEQRGPVLLLSIEELLRALETRSFAEIVRDLRNRRVHGVP